MRKIAGFTMPQSQGNNKLTNSTSTKAFIVGVVALLSSLLPASDAIAQSIFVPQFWDPQKRIERPDLGSLRVIRFITEGDYPPFDFALPDGSLAGFNVDLARALCEELRVQCTVQERRWDTILPAIERGDADAAIASLALTPANRARVDFTAPYYKTPARFVARLGAPAIEIRPDKLAGHVIGVEAKTAHEAFLRTFFPQATPRPYENAAALRSALKRNEIDLAFGDGIAFAVWLNGTDAGDCCGFVGGPFTDSNYFGEGVGIGVRKGNSTLRRALDFALKRIAERGVYADIYLKYFPIGFY